MSLRKFYIQTFGCQMNEYDSLLLENLLTQNGFISVETPEEADVIIVNTCAVREKPERRGVEYALKYKKAGKKVILMGCTAQKRGKDLLSKVDAVVGTREFDKVLDILKNNEAGVIYTSFRSLRPYKHWKRNRVSFSEFVTIQIGCDNFCTYCIVPYTRGREVCRSVEEILEELKFLEEKGVKEVTLLGQNVNSYFYEGVDFADLLKIIDESVGIPRIYFTTSHPRDMSLKVIKVVKESSHLMPWFHLPLQAGSTRVLRDMGRGYTKEEFIDLARSVRRLIPEATITTDIMVGFPTETEEDFLETLEVVEKVKFDHAYMFIYSPRYPSRACFLYKNGIDEKIKGKRLRRLIEKVNEGILEQRKKMLGKTCELLIEGPSRKNPEFSRGKTRGNITCVVPGIYEPGTFVEVRIEEIRGLTPVGIPIEVTSQI